MKPHTGPAMIMLHIDDSTGNPPELYLPAGSFAFTPISPEADANGEAVRRGLQTSVWVPGEKGVWSVKETHAEIAALLIGARSDVRCAQRFLSDHVACMRAVSASPTIVPDATVRIIRETADAIDKLIAVAARVVEEVDTINLDGSSIALLAELREALRPFAKPLWETTVQLRARLGRRELSMDWTSVEGDKLLWEAWPAGYLATRGVLTVGGWTCYEPGFIGSLGGWRWIHPQTGLSNIAESHKAGDLLPLPDPADVATWSALIEDLAVAVHAGGCTRGLLFGLDDDGEWTLRSWWGNLAGWRFDTDDPAEALVRARAQLRKAKK